MDIIKRCCKEKAGNGIKDEVCWRKCINAMHKKLSHIRLLPPASTPLSSLPLHNSTFSSINESNYYDLV